ncbi:MAG: hemerythrin family protein [Gallionellaceae bacterium]|nr:hemerythrin family protein [Gallionellaceae bacterium]
MALMWRDQLSVGNNVIDGDHKYLVEIINEVEQSLKAKNKSALAATLEKLAKYSQVHFDREERIAQAAGYTQVPTLSQSHQALMKKLEQMTVDTNAMGMEWSAETGEHFAAFLRDWLLDHVIKEDLLMKPVLQKHSPSFDPR